MHSYRIASVEDLRRVFTEVSKLDLRKPLLLSIKPWSDTPSDRQRRRHWAIMQEIASLAEVDGKRFTADTWHTHFKGLFLGWEDLPGGTMVPKSSTGLTRGEYSDFTDACIAYAATDLGLQLSGEWE